MDEECVHEIRRVLPELDNECLEALVGHLAFVVGVKEKKHLAFLEYDDLTYCLTRIQSRQIIDAFKPKGENNNALNYTCNTHAQRHSLTIPDPLLLGILIGRYT